MRIPPLAAAAPLALAATIAALLLAPPARPARADDDLGVEGDFHAKAGAGAPVWEYRRGDSVFFEKVPESVREREKCERTSLSSNDATKVEGEFKLDYDMPDFTGLSEPKPPEVVCRWKSASGGAWRLVPAKDAMIKRGNIASSSAKQAYAFGATNLGTPLEPKQRLVFRMKGKCRLEKDGKSVTQDAPFELVVGSKTRDRDTGKYATEYEALQEGLEVKVLVPESCEVPEYGKGLALVFTGATAQ